MSSSQYLPRPSRRLRAPGGTRLLVVCGLAVTVAASCGTTHHVAAPAPSAGAATTTVPTTTVRTTVPAAATTTAPAPTASATVATTTSTTVPPPSTVPSIPATASVPSAPVGPPICAPTQLRVALGRSVGALSHSAIPLIFTDVGSPCVMTGYPGVALLDTAGAQVVEVSRARDGFVGGLPSGAQTLPVVHLTTGRSASALLQTPSAGPNGGTCPVYPGGILVTAPDTRPSVHIAGAFRECAPIVTPVVAGRRGGAF